MLSLNHWWTASLKIYRHTRWITRDFVVVFGGVLVKTFADKIEKRFSFFSKIFLLFWTFFQKLCCFHAIGFRNADKKLLKRCIGILLYLQILMEPFYSGGGFLILQSLWVWQRKLKFPAISQIFLFYFCLNDSGMSGIFFVYRCQKLVRLSNADVARNLTSSHRQTLYNRRQQDSNFFQVLFLISRQIYAWTGFACKEAFEQSLFICGMASETLRKSISAYVFSTVFLQVLWKIWLNFFEITKVLGPVVPFGWIFAVSTREGSGIFFLLKNFGLHGFLCRNRL